MPGEFHGQRSLAGYSPRGHKESDTTEQLTHKVIIRGEFIHYMPVIKKKKKRKKEQPQISDLSFHLKKLENKEQMKFKISRRKITQD